MLRPSPFPALLACRLTAGGALTAAPPAALYRPPVQLLAPRMLGQVSMIDPV
jgi:hypothetical protein